MFIGNYLVDYRNCDIDETRSDLTHSYNQFISSSSAIGVVPGVVVNDNKRPCRRVLAEERLHRLHGLEVRDTLRQAIVDHSMHCSSKDNGWFYNCNNHTVR